MKSRLWKRSAYSIMGAGGAAGSLLASAGCVGSCQACFGCLGTGGLVVLLALLGKKTSNRPSSDFR